MSVTVKVADNSAQKNKIKGLQVSTLICEFMYKIIQTKLKDCTEITKQSKMDFKF